MKNRFRPVLAIALIVTGIGPALAQQPVSQEEMEIRAKAIATRRAERDASRAERLPSRPIVLREPIPLPVQQILPPGGAPVAQSCPAAKPCKIEYAVPPGRILVVSALWSASDVHCDQATLGATPPSGEAISPWWHCRKSLSFTGKAAGFTGYLFSPPSTE